MSEKLINTTTNGNVATVTLATIQRINGNTKHNVEIGGRIGKKQQHQTVTVTSSSNITKTFSSRINATRTFNLK